MEKIQTSEEKKLSTEKNTLNSTLLEAKARLETYWSMGHNFLKSKDKNQIERDFYDLENALNLGANRILGSGATLKDIPLIRALDASWKEINYQDLLNAYKKDYKSATKKFRWERARLATKWWLSTAAITFGTSAAMQALTGTWMFAKDAVAGTPEVPDSTSTTNTWNVTDNFGMWRYELAGWNKIFNAAQDNIAWLDSSSSVTLHLWAGTDGTAVRAGSSLLNHWTYLDKLAQVKDVIDHSSLSNKTDLISQLDKWFATSGFTNTDLHGMRCLEAIEETVKWAWNFAGKLNISYDTALDIDWSVAYDASSRMSQAFLEITKVIPGKPWVEAVEAGNKWLVIGLPWFSNTFKRNNDGKPEQRPVTPVVNEPNDNPNDKWDDNWKNKWDDKQKNEWLHSTIIVPPAKSDERNEIKEETNKDEEITEELKKDVKDDLYKVFHKDDMNKDDFKKKYENSEFALKRLKEAEDFWKKFPKTNFYDKNIVDSLKEEFKDNLYILDRISRELKSWLDSQFKHYLTNSDIEKYKDRAKAFVDSAMLNEDYARYWIRPMIVIKLSDELSIPFYLSTWFWNKPWVPTDKFYPIFWVWSDWRLNKWSESEINNYYGSPLLAAIAKELDKKYKDKEISVSERWNSNKEFDEKANIWKNPVVRKDSKNSYDNINETLKKVSKIKETD